MSWSSGDINAIPLPDQNTIAACYERAASVEGKWKKYIMEQGMLSWIIIIGKHRGESTCEKSFSCGRPAPSGTFEKELIILLANLLEVT